MFQSKKSSISNISGEITSTIIGEGMKIENAILTGTNAIRIDGWFIGKIDIESNLILGESGKIEGDINVKNALIAGSIQGNITSSESVHLSSTARLTGNIGTNALIIDEGAIFNGKCKMEKELVYDTD